MHVTHVMNKDFVGCFPTLIHFMMIVWYIYIYHYDIHAYIKNNHGTMVDTLPLTHANHCPWFCLNWLRGHFLPLAYLPQLPRGLPRLSRRSVGVLVSSFDVAHCWTTVSGRLKHFKLSLRARRPTFIILQIYMCFELVGSYIYIYMFDFTKIHQNEWYLNNLLFRFPWVTPAKFLISHLFMSNDSLYACNLWPSQRRHCDNAAFFWTKRIMPGNIHMYTHTSK